MPQYTSDQHVRSGVPLGGIGAGKLEIMPDGTLDHFTFLNSIHRPYASTENQAFRGVLGFHFALFVQDKGKKSVRLLQTSAIKDYPTLDLIRYDGRYPLARLHHEDEKLPVACSLEAYSPFVPGDEKNSAFPAAVFRFKIFNPHARPVTVSLLGVGRNIIGSWGLGRFNQVAEDKEFLSMNFYNKKTLQSDPSSGEMALSVVKSRNAEVFYCGEWNMQDAPFVFEKNSLTFGEAWSAFAHDGSLPNTNTERVVASESFQLGGALASRVYLKGRSSTTFTFILSWYFPGFGEGRMYENWFRNVTDVTRVLVAKEDGFYKAVKAWGKSIEDLKLDPWVKDALQNNLYPLASSSLWTKKGRFGIFEGAESCPLTGTLDVRFYGSLPLALLFPNLEIKELIQFAEAQRPQGYVPHDLGWQRSDLPSNSTNGLLWKDLNAKFILMCYRDYLWTKDEALLRKMYPFVKKAFIWISGTDKNKDFLPDNEGADQTFDLWPFYGAGSYASGIFLASLLALEKMASRVQDTGMAQEALEWFKKGRASFEKKLWHKTYYLAYNNAKENLSEKQLVQYAKVQKVGLACISGQLVGQWIAHLLGLGYVLPEDRVKKAVATMLAKNAAASPLGAVNAVLPSGEKDKSNAHSENCWVGMAYVLASLAIMEGFHAEGWALAQKTWHHFTGNVKNPWNQPDMYASSDGVYLFGDHCMRNMVAWALLLAKAGGEKSVDIFLAGMRKA
jgi:non-lysosomal glucosylceramidase